VGGEILDMDLDARTVAGEILHGHAALLPDHHGLLAVGGQGDLDDTLVRGVHLPCHKQ